MNIKQPGIYIIRNKLTGDGYIGSAVNIASRWAAHRHNLATRKKSPPKLQQAWDEHGSDAFEFQVLEVCAKESLLEREQFHIDSNRPAYNTRAEAKSNIGMKWSAETNSKKGRPRQVYTVNGVTGSLRKLAKHFGVVTSECARWRIERGMAPADAVLTPAATMSDRGKKSQQERDWGDTLKRRNAEVGLVSYFAARARVQRGWTVEDAINTPLLRTRDAS